ncbi:concanavalin A-like lectin protein kinase family protein [Actinidia rufa]|uniref:Concanavalin A-like lectin protein kinase family protein n=1 Tax=Actinidia rufa TaxID=165716 RepID=A0A7J0FJG7_9ERIC|nr:concanavalin A-like lectin protein kinase family protein [Actinidia rufa]
MLGRRANARMTETMLRVLIFYLGILNASNNDLASNHLLAIEFDTIKSPEFNDINDNHVGIDVNSLTSLASAPVTHYSNSDGTNKTLQMTSGKPIQVWIDYDQGKNLLNVALAPIESPNPERSPLSTKIDLSQIFLDSMYVGFSAATGAMTSSHYILGWSFSRYGQAQNLELSKLPSLPRQRKPRNKQSLEITISLIVLAVVLVITMGGFLYFVRRNKYEEIREDWEQEYGPRRFSFKDLYKAAKGFKDKGLLGTGGFGKVYKGVLKSSKEAVAVKRVSHCSKQGMKEFVAEIASMGRLRHRNLVKLLGYSRRRGELLLLGDFGLARLYDHGENPQTTHVVGTVGYLAPELTRTGKATTSTDVFGFEHFCLKWLVEGAYREQTLSEEMMLVDWVFESWKQGAILDTSDLRLGGDYSADENGLGLKLGLLCSHANPASMA